MKVEIPPGVVFVIELGRQNPDGSFKFHDYRCPLDGLLGLVEGLEVSVVDGAPIPVLKESIRIDKA